jgi:hypothetical protein
MRSCVSPYKPQEKGRPVRSALCDDYEFAEIFPPTAYSE